MVLQVFDPKVPGPIDHVKVNVGLPKQDAVLAMVKGGGQKENENGRKANDVPMKCVLVHLAMVNEDLLKAIDVPVVFDQGLVTVNVDLLKQVDQDLAMVNVGLLKAIDVPVVFDQDLVTVNVDLLKQVDQDLAMVNVGLLKAIDVPVVFDQGLVTVNVDLLKQVVPNIAMENVDLPKVIDVPVVFVPDLVTVNVDLLKQAVDLAMENVVIVKHDFGQGLKEVLVIQETKDRASIE